MSAPLINGLGGVSGFGEDFLDRNDDGSTLRVDFSSVFEDGLNFFGNQFTGAFINNNGSITFNSPRSSFTPDVITAASNNPEITPFFGDVDTRGGATTATPGGTSTGSNLVYYDSDVINDRVVITWDDVGYFSSNTSKLNAFQLILTDRSDGDFDIEFRYEDINWTTGEASGGTDGLGGEVARAGFTSGTGNPDAFFELPASGVQNSVLSLDDDPGNTGDPGRWLFSVRNGDVVNGNIPQLPITQIIGANRGDPHLVTLDGVGYDFQAAGEFVLLRDTRGGGFEIQSRMTPTATDVSINEAIATQVGATEVMIDAARNSPVLINGIETVVDNFDSVSFDGGAVFRSRDSYTIVYEGADGIVNDGDSQVIVDVIGGRVDMSVQLGAEFSGNLEGLLGDGDGNSDNDIARADGTVLSRPLLFTDLYGAYRDDWRVDNLAESLFTYDSGEGPDTFYLPSFPSQIVSLDQFSASEVSTAQTAAETAGLTPGTLTFDDAVLDFLLTGDESFFEISDSAPVLLSSAAIEVTQEAGPTEGDDLLLGTTQNDTINALGGDDTVNGLTGDDLIIGGRGNDNIKGSGGDDRLRGNGGDDTLKGGGGDDNIKGNGGDDSIKGNGGADVIKAGGGADTVKGGGGSDVINGGAGADILQGGGGNDTITGKGGDDTLKGNGGADVFQFRASDRNDTILDFRQGQDLIEIQTGANSFAGLSFEQDGRDVLIGFGAGQVRVVTDSVGAFDEDDFIF